MRVFGLIGFPLSHSFSAGYFAKKFEEQNISDAIYRNFPIEKIEFLPEIIHNTPELIGLNVTIPYKQKVIPFLNKLSGSAREIGAVNTIKIDRSSGKIELTGFNTDEYGFEESLKPFLKPIHTQALILGTGGASKAVEYALTKLGIRYLSVSRNPQNDNQINYSQLNEEILASHLIIINTSPVGMFPNVNDCPDLPYNLINSNHLLYDLVYNPLETAFMRKGTEKGAMAVNGLKMLHLQAEKAWEIWNK